jgi:hypothetical protein
MRIPACVMTDIRAQFSSDEANVWTTAWDCLPDSIISLASTGKMPTKKAYATCKKMTASGWMALQGQGRRLRPIALIPHVTQEKMARILEEEYEAAFNKGEFLTKRYLDLAVHSENCIENARLEILKNITGEPMEFDRYYREKVAFEFNGPQHLGVTEKFTDEMAALELQSRDTRKVWLCEKADIILVRIYVADLHPHIMTRLIPSRLQRSYIDEQGPYYKTLCDLCAAYIAKATRVDIQQIMSGKPSR